MSTRKQYAGAHFMPYGFYFVRFTTLLVRLRLFVWFTSVCLEIAGEDEFILFGSECLLTSGNLFAMTPKNPFFPQRTGVVA